MTCSTLRALIHEYIDGELPPHRRAAFEEHDTRCDACSEAVAIERTMLNRIRDSLRATPVPHWLYARVSAAIAAASTEPQSA